MQKHLPDDLEALEAYTAVNSQLVDERSAGAVRIMEDLQEGEELVARIQEAKTAEEEVITLVIGERQKRVLDISRKMGPLATTDETLS
jgi:hypothetical protein